MSESITDLNSKRAGYYEDTRPEMQSYVPATVRRLLEVGCGEGNFAAAIKASRGCETWGADLSPTAAAIAAKRLDRVLCGDFASVLGQLPASCFDCVVFNDVLEHLSDPFSALVGIQTCLAPGGVVVASIPNVRHISAFKCYVMHADWKYEDVGVLDKTHLRFFTKKSIVRMFESLGYVLERIEGINASPSWKLKVANALLLGALSDVRYLQFACVARPAGRARTM